MRGRFHRQRGSALVEFAIFAPMFVLMFMGVMEMGRYATYAILAQASARSGANYGASNLMTGADLNNIKAWGTGDAQYLPAGYTYTYNYLCSVNGQLPPKTCSFSGSSPPTNTVYYIQFTITATYAPWINYPGIPSTITVKGSDYQRIAQQ